jgi:hypothetical protein
MIPKETVLSGAEHPGTKLEILKSSAGWYIGFRDRQGAPYSRESRYFATKKGAEAFMSGLRSA